MGLIPLEALLSAGRHYLEAAGENPGIPHKDLLQVAIRSLGLSDLKPFEPSQSIIENQIASDGPLVRQTLRAFTDLLSSDAPAPGGGSIAALLWSTSKRFSGNGWTVVDKNFCKILPYAQPRPSEWTDYDTCALNAQRLKEAFLHDVDADTQAFDAMMAAMRLPKATPEQRKSRVHAIREARRQAIETPLGVLEVAWKRWNV